MTDISHLLGKIHNVDALPFMRSLPNKCCLIVTDLPYGLNKKIHDGGTWSTHEKYDAILKWDFKPTKELFDEIRRVSKDCIIWGGNYFTEMLPMSRCWLAWVKPHFPTMSELDLVWTSFDRPAKVYYCPRVNPSIHPTQKPEKLMRFCIENYTEKDDIIFDPFMGSGTTAVACERLGRKWFSCELELSYCKIAEEMIAAERNQLKFF